MTRVVLRPREFDAVIFDLDGVITRTAVVHENAWASLFDSYLRGRSVENQEVFEPFTSEDYGLYVDGKPRYDGVKSFLESRGIELEWGHPSDPPESETICGLGNRKNAEFLRLVAKDGVEPFESSVRLVHALQDAGVGTALFSASRNVAEVLEAADISDLFPVIVDGRAVSELGLAGKPQPDQLLETARRLGASPRRTAVVEDAISGVMSGRRGGFGLIIGVDRKGQAAALAEHADVVVSDLDEVDVDPKDDEPAMRSDLPSATTSYEELRSLAGTRRPVVFLDYDGVLSPIVEHPDLATLSPEMSSVLERLASTTTVAIVSGRDVEDVMDKVGLSGLYYAGSHGFDIRTPSGAPVADGDLPQFDEFPPALDGAEAELREHLAAVPGANVERKRFAIAVHFRQVPDDYHAAVRDAVERVAPGYPTLRVAGGKMIYELRPDFDWDKGTALLWLLTEIGLDEASVLPIYLGDDVTDEDAFRVLRGRGVGVVVGREELPTSAHYSVEDTDEVRVYLDQLRQLAEEIHR
jgi:alpha,alpha-trehalase